MTEFQLILFGLNIFYLSQDMIKDREERKAMFSPLHNPLILFNEAWSQSGYSESQKKFYSSHNFQITNQIHGPWAVNLMIAGGYSNSLTEVGTFTYMGEHGHLLPPRISRPTRAALF